MNTRTGERDREFWVSRTETCHSWSALKIDVVSCSKDLVDKIIIAAVRFVRIWLKASAFGRLCVILTQSSDVMRPVMRLVLLLHAYWQCLANCHGIYSKDNNGLN